MSVDREERLYDLEQRWPGPIVAAVYTRSSSGAPTSCVFVVISTTIIIFLLQMTPLPNV
jgi:hypothetical protein